MSKTGVIFLPSNMRLSQNLIGLNPIYFLFQNDERKEGINIIDEVWISNINGTKQQ